MKRILLLMLLLAGCGGLGDCPASHDTPQSLLEAYVQAQANPELLKGLCYRPGNIETFDQNLDEFILDTSNSHLTIRNALLEGFDDSELQKTRMVHNGVVAVAMPKPVGWLRVNFEDAEGVSDRYTRALYGEADGKYFITTWQKTNNVE